MWYAIQVPTGKEFQTKEAIEMHIDSDFFKEIIVLRYATQMKVHGTFKDVKRMLLPGYLIVVSNNIEKFHEQLRAIPYFTKILSSAQGFSPLQPEEITWLDTFSNNEHRVIPMSKAIKEGDQVRIVSGPLLSLQAKVAKIDRHRSTAYIQTHICGRTVETKLGLAVLSKKSF